MAIDYTKRTTSHTAPSTGSRIDYTKGTASGSDRGKRPPAVGLEKLRTTAPGLVSLYKQAAVSLERYELTGERAAVYLVLDRSGSMRRYYRDGSVQRLAEQALGLAAHFDDDGSVPVVFFSTEVDGLAEVSLDAYQGRVNAVHEALGHMGRTNYAAAMEAVIAHYQRSGATDPAYVIFQTDGAPESRSRATRTLCEAARLPLFWQFVGFGDDEFAYLRKLDELPVPHQRVVDNAGFFAVGPRPGRMSDAELYDRLMGEFPHWLRAARHQGIVR
ncbi:vWA domain-containing protein [Wenjunlia tyrosinilytica]|uniref:Toxic cation resistance protein n=1 Tax=Wenjunlia tyrosinilytica TaxID=1544741 RepID=A0A917ZW07_9ACTN|nr:VWA domain-containing protein [Wenjunlia tyrosinilytica]GGO97024.1 toxic cation resistance protein [Wenjunlia tyrosinilytica]